MTRTSLLTLALLLGTGGPALAETFVQAPILPDAGVAIVTRAVAQEMVGRRLFGEPYATTVIGNVDVYSRFPYLEARYFQVVSDPQWNRLLYGEIGQDLRAFDGAGSSFGALRSPHGVASDAAGRVYVADSGNDRVLVFDTAGEYGSLALTPKLAIDGLAAPFDVAVSDAGTPLDDEDDFLYVADSGRNRIVAYTLRGTAAEMVAQIGDLGSGEGFFAGPMALAVGKRDGASTDDLYVADAHNGRLVHLRFTGQGFAWMGALAHNAGIITSLATDHNGNLYASAPNSGSVQKYTAQLVPVAQLSDGISRPRSFHVPFVTVHDHRNGTQTRAGQGRGILVEEWKDDSGMRLIDLGVEVRALDVVQDGGITARFMLTDQADVTVEVIDPQSGRTVGQHAVENAACGPQSVRLEAKELSGADHDGQYLVRVSAVSRYDEQMTSHAEAPVELSADGASLPSRVALLGNSPNPFNPSTQISFAVPAGGSRPYSLRVYDAKGRLVSTLAAGEIGPGQHTVTWNGQDARGRTVGSGVYHYRLAVGDEELNDNMVLVK